MARSVSRKARPISVLLSWVGAYDDILFVDVEDFAITIGSVQYSSIIYVYLKLSY